MRKQVPVPRAIHPQVRILTWTINAMQATQCAVSVSTHRCTVMPLSRFDQCCSHLRMGSILPALGKPKRGDVRPVPTEHVVGAMHLKASAVAATVRRSVVVKHGRRIVAAERRQRAPRTDGRFGVIFIRPSTKLLRRDVVIRVRQHVEDVARLSAAGAMFPGRVASTNTSGGVARAVERAVEGSLAAAHWSERRWRRRR
jgi:hypothetical protein